MAPYTYLGLTKQNALCVGASDVIIDQQTRGQLSRPLLFWNRKTDGLAAFGFWYLNKDKINFLSLGLP